MSSLPIQDQFASQWNNAVALVETQEKELRIELMNQVNGLDADVTRREGGLTQSLAHSLVELSLTTLGESQEPRGG